MFLSICLMISFVISAESVSGAIALEMSLKTDTMKKEEKIEGRYDVILYGSRHADDVETIAILDKVGDEYTFEPYAPEHDYKVMKNISASEALKHALPFVSWHRSFRNVERNRITDKKGRAIGYELRPLYEPLSMGEMDVMYVNYQIKGNKVIVYIRLKESVERVLEGDGDSGWRFGR
ncbi:MAG: hypothetical protein V3V59_06715 [Thermodesulfovibrionales bacterium]